MKIEGFLISESFSVDIGLGQRLYIDYGNKNEIYQIIDVSNTDGQHLPYWTHMNEIIVRFNGKDWLVKRDHQKLWLEEDICLRG